jgi:hypothetical protein
VVVTRNFFAPLRAAAMDTDSSSTEATTQEEAVLEKTGRLPPIVITAATNLMQLQIVIRNVVKNNFEFCNTRNGPRVITKTLVDLETHNLPYITFYPKSLKSIKAVKRHLPINTPAEHIAHGLMGLGFDIISVKQMTSTRRSLSEVTPTKNLPLFLITLPRMAKSQENFRLTGLCHIAIRVEAYRAQNGLMQCHNCQQFGHVCANCKPLPHCNQGGGV